MREELHWSEYSLLLFANCTRSALTNKMVCIKRSMRCPSFRRVVEVKKKFRKGVRQEWEVIQRATPELGLKEWESRLNCGCRKGHSMWYWRSVPRDTSLRDIQYHDWISQTKIIVSFVPQTTGSKAGSNKCPFLHSSSFREANYLLSVISYSQIWLANVTMTLLLCSLCYPWLAVSIY